MQLAITVSRTGSKNPAYKHGHATRNAHSRIYDLWWSMKARCENPKNKYYSSYGNRGICVCERWQDFENFYADMGAPEDGYSIDRIDNSKGYEPDNCKWASPKEQANNRRSNRLITVGSETKTLMQWADYSGIGWATIRMRLEAGWTPEKAVTAPLRSIFDRNRLLTIQYEGRTWTMSELQKMCGIYQNTLRQRIFQLGWSVEKAITTPSTRAKKFDPNPEGHCS